MSLICFSLSCDILTCKLSWNIKHVNKLLGKMWIWVFSQYFEAFIFHNHRNAFALLYHFIVSFPRNFWSWQSSKKYFVLLQHVSTGLYFFEDQIWDASCSFWVFFFCSSLTVLHSKSPGDMGGDGGSDSVVRHKSLYREKLKKSWEIGKERDAQVLYGWLNLQVVWQTTIPLGILAELPCSI